MSLAPGRSLRPNRISRNNSVWSLLPDHPPSFSPGQRLQIALLESPDVRFRIVGNVPDEILEITQQRVYVRVVPAATRHLGRESADKLEAIERSRWLCEHGCRDAVVTV